MKQGLLLAATFILHTWILGQTDSSSVLDEVVVTANRFPQKQQQTGKVLTVIPRSVLEKNSSRNLGEILNQYAGFAVVGANNNLGTNLDVYTRGASLGNTLILVDGVPVYDVSSISSAFDLNFMTPNMIERVEVLKGGQSTVYGSDAVAGVINIITRKAAKEGLQGQASLAAGSFGTLKAGAGIHGKKNNQDFNLQYQYIRTDGLSSAFDSSGSKGYDKDGLQQHNVGGRFSGKINERLQWKLTGQANLYSAELDANAFADDRDHEVDNKNFIAGTGLDYQMGSTTFHGNYTLNFTQRDYLDDSLSVGGFSKFSTSSFSGLSHYAELYANSKVSDQISILAGVDGRWQKTTQDYLSISDYGPYTSSLSGDSAKINIFSAYASAFLRTNSGFFMEAGGRWNNHSMYGNNFTYSVNPSFVKGSWKLFLNLSSAFKAPTLYQLYDPMAGNAALKPERSLSYEAGVQWRGLDNALQTRVVAFARDLQDGIDYSFLDFRYFNYSKAKDRGLELESFLRLKKWNITFNYTWLNGEVSTVKYEFDSNSFTYIAKGDTSFNYQFRRPAHSGNIGVAYRISDRWSASLNSRFVSKRSEPRFMAAPLELPGYAVLDVYTEYRVLNNCRIFLDIRNILDKEYVDINGFTTRPINLMTGLSFSF